MSTACDAASLISGAACLECGIPPGMEKSVIISLLAKIAGVSTDPATLISGAACLECGVPSGMQDSVIMSLLCQIANHSADYTSGLITLNSVTTHYSVTHGLGVTPTLVRVVAVVQSTVFANSVNSGYLPGDELDILSLFDTNIFAPVTVATTATTISANFPEALGGGSTYSITKGAGGLEVNVAATDIKLKVYAWK